MDCPWMLPVGVVSGVLMSAWASTHTMPSSPTAAAWPWMEPIARLMIPWHGERDEKRKGKSHYVMAHSNMFIDVFWSITNQSWLVQTERSDPMWTRAWSFSYCWFEFNLMGLRMGTSPWFWSVTLTCWTECSCCWVVNRLGHCCKSTGHTFNFWLQLQQFWHPFIPLNIWNPLWFHMGATSHTNDRNFRTWLNIFIS